MAGKAAGRAGGSPGTARPALQVVVCSPHEYAGAAFQAFMRRECAAASSRWIYDIIDDTFAPGREQVFLRRPEWCLCADHHHTSEPRYLVIFADRALRTLRDLRAEHAPLLAEIAATVREWLAARHAAPFHLYFHYMPSIFQLHLHVSASRQNINVHRAHYLPLVLRNLGKDSLHYAQALLLTKACRTLRRAETHSALRLPI